MKKFHWLKLAGLMALTLSAPSVSAQVKVGILSTQFVLEQKFKLMEQAAKNAGVDLAWTQVDREGDAGVKRVMRDANLLIIDAPRSDDIAQIERGTAGALRSGSLPMLNINVMNPPDRLKPVNLDPSVADRLFGYYSGGTPVNHQRMFQYLSALLTEGDVSKVPEPVKLPNGGIYHPQFADLIFDKLPDYLAWWDKQSGKHWQQMPVIAMEISSSYIADGQLRMLNETVQGIEQAGGVPLVFYRSTRVGRNDAEKAGGKPAAMPGNGRRQAGGSWLSEP